MSTQKTISYDEITRRVSKHFENADELNSYFATVYREPATPPPANPATRERLRRIEQHPAVVAFADFMTFRNFLASLGAATPIDDENMQLSMGTEEGRAVWDAARALKKLVQTPPGPAILVTLVGLIPREAEPRPNKLARHIRKVLKGEVGAALLRACDAFFNAHHAN